MFVGPLIPRFWAWAYGALVGSRSCAHGDPGTLLLHLPNDYFAYQPVIIKLFYLWLNECLTSASNALADREKFIFNKKAIGLAAVAKLKSCKILNISSLHYHSTTVVKW